MYKQSILSILGLFLITFSIAQTANQFYTDGKALQDEKKYSEALELFKKAIVKNPDYKEAIYNAGWTCNELQKYSEAIPYLQRAVTLWPKEPKVYLELGYAYEKTDQMEKTISNYNYAISIKPDYALAYKYLAIVYYDTYEYKKSLENINLFLKYEPNSNSDDIYFRKAVSENELGKYSEALASIKKADAMKPENVKFLNEMGYTYYLLSNADEALNSYNRALELDSKSLTAMLGRADIYRKLKKNPTEAIKLYGKALELNDKHKTANFWTGWCLNDLGKYSEAIPFLKKVIEADDQYVAAFTELGYCDYALKNYDDALDNFKKAFAIEKTALNLYYTGLCFVGKKEKPAASKMITDLKILDPSLADKLQKEVDKL